MPLNLDEKKALVSQVAEVANQAISAAVADYRGLTVAQMNELRFKGRGMKVVLKVIPNTLAIRALEGTDFACLAEKFVGPSLLALSLNEPSAAAKLFREFAKSNEKFSVKALALNGRAYEAKEIDAIAELPTYEEAVAKLLFVLQAPITKFVRTLAEPHARLVRVFAAVREQKQQAS